MADINAAASGTQNQNPFGVNMSDGIGQGREPEISPTAPDDDLNKNADELEYLNDTDHSTMMNEINLIQSMQETLAENDSGDHEFRGEFHSVQAAIESAMNEITFLNKYKRKISAVGINTNDILALESNYPKMLVQVGNGFTLESNDSNKEAALEAIGEKIANILKTAKVRIAKFIEWVSARVSTLHEAFSKHSFDARVAKLQARIKSGRKVLSVKELIAKLNNDTVAWDRSNIVTSYGEAIGLKLTLTDFTSVANTRDPHAWLRIVMNMHPNTKGTTADRNAVVNYGNSLKKMASDLKLTKLDGNAESLVSAMDQRMIALHEASPFDPEVSADLNELYNIGLRDTDNFGAGVVRNIKESLDTLSGNLKTFRDDPNSDEELVKQYFDIFNDLGQCINELLIAFKRNHQITARTFLFIDFAIWACDDINGLKPTVAKAA